jgi:hypothetical protein
MCQFAGNFFIGLRSKIRYQPLGRANPNEALPRFNHARPTRFNGCNKHATSLFFTGNYADFSIHCVTGARILSPVCLPVSPRPPGRPNALILLEEGFASGHDRSLHVRFTGATGYWHFQPVAARATD